MVKSKFNTCTISQVSHMIRKEATPSPNASQQNQFKKQKMRRKVGTVVTLRCHKEEPLIAFRCRSAATALCAILVSPTRWQRWMRVDVTIMIVQDNLPCKLTPPEQTAQFQLLLSALLQSGLGWLLCGFLWTLLMTHGPTRWVWAVSQGAQTKQCAQGENKNQTHKSL